MTEYVDCPRCRGLGTHNGIELCDNCGGRGEVAQRQKRVLPSNSRRTFFRGALVSHRNSHRK
jgi:DnaJ-class molecular chaperone